MDTTSPLTSRLRFIDQQGAEIDGPREWRPCFVEIDAPPSELEAITLACNGDLLVVASRRVGGRIRVVADWPRSGTGRYRLNLQTETVHNQLTFEVGPEKITSEAYGRLLEDLQSHLPASIAISLQRAGALAGIELRPPGPSTLAQEFERLRTAVRGTHTYRGLADTLTAIARDPHRMLTKTQAWVPRERVRRLEPAGLVAALQRANNIDETNLPILAPDVRVEHTTDVYENRLLRHYATHVAARLRRLRTTFVANDKPVAAAETSGLIEQLERGRNTARFLDEVSELRQAPTTVTMVLLKRSEYRSLLEGYIRFTRSAFVELDDPALDAPLENLPHLYEAWGALQVIHALLEIAPECGYVATSQQLAVPIRGSLCIQLLPGNKTGPLLTLESSTASRSINLYYQREYGQARTAHLHSISFAQTPDIAIELIEPTSPTRVWIFDPKYKLNADATGEGAGRPQKEDIDKMHAYRDAIRRSSDGQRPTEYAAILYPGPTEWFNEVEALSANPAIPDDLIDILHTRLQTMFSRITDDL